MSEHRQPVEVYTRRLPQNEGKKPHKNCKQKIELFPAHYWAMDWEPGSELFYPRPPLQSEARKEFWETHFRVRENGAWLGKTTKYVFFTRQQIADFFIIRNFGQVLQTPGRVKQKINHKEKV